MWSQLRYFVATYARWATHFVTIVGLRNFLQHRVRCLSNLATPFYSKDWVFVVSILRIMICQDESDALLKNDRSWEKFQQFFRDIAEWLRLFFKCTLWNEDKHTHTKKKRKRKKARLTSQPFGTLMLKKKNFDTNEKTSKSCGKVS